jgi:copper chaperone CopZ
MYELKVEGMTCGGCAKGVSRSVQMLDRTAKVDVDLQSKMVRIETTASLDAVTSAIVNAGYPVITSNVA